MQTVRDGRDYIEFEFAAKAGSYIRHALAVVTVGNGVPWLVSTCTHCSVLLQSVKQPLHLCSHVRQRRAMDCTCLSGRGYEVISNWLGRRLALRWQNSPDCQERPRLGCVAYLGSEHAPECRARLGGQATSTRW